MRMETEKVTVRLYKGDRDKLLMYFPSIGYNRALREIVRSFIRGVEEKAQAKRSSVSIDLGEINVKAMEAQDGE